ncbi:MAG: hypothetical protein RL407_1252 [Bacteroidota bacterium]
MTTIFGVVLSFSLLLSSCGGSSSESTSAEDGEVAEGSSSDCDQFISDYEDFADAYIVVLEKMKADPTDASVMTEYTEMMSKLTELQTGGQGCTDPEDIQKISEIAMKISTAASGM